MECSDSDKGLNKKKMSLPEIANWLEKNCFGFYGGCRFDSPHSPQVREFVDALHYYLELDFGYISDRRKKIKNYR